jgi:hypothetical protein
VDNWTGHHVSAAVGVFGILTGTAFRYEVVEERNQKQISTLHTVALCYWVPEHAQPKN